MVRHQYALWAVPRAPLLEHLGEMPPKLDPAVMDGSAFWTARSAAALEAEFDKLLSRVADDDPQVLRWGPEFGDQILLLLTPGGAIAQVGFRINLRRQSRRFFHVVLDLATRHDWLLLSVESHRLIPPIEEAALIRDMKRSQAARIVSFGAPNFKDESGQVS